MGRRRIAAVSLFFLAGAVASAQRPDCSIRPPRGTPPEELSRMAKVTSKDAEARATSAGGTSSEGSAAMGCSRVRSSLGVMGGA